MASTCRHVHGFWNRNLRRVCTEYIGRYGTWMCTRLITGTLE